MTSQDSQPRPDDSTDSETTSGDDLGDFDDFQDDAGDESAAIDDVDVDEARRTTIEAAPEPIDPLADDFRVGDPAIDLATGRTVVLVDRVAERTDDHSEREGYDFLDNYGNKRLRTNEADPVFEAVYVNSLSSKPSKSYDFPTSRLGRPLYENVDGVDRIYDVVARDVLKRLFFASDAFDLDALAADDPDGVLLRRALEAGFDGDVVDEARELADVDRDFGGNDDA